MDIEMKWEKFKNEKMIYGTIKKVNKLLCSVSIIIFLVLMLSTEFKSNMMTLTFTFLLFFSLIGWFFLLGFLENWNEKKLETFFKENQEQIMTLEIEETLELNDVLQEHEKSIFLIITSEVRARRKQTFHFSTNSKNGNEVRVYEKDNASEYFYHQIAKFTDNKPRLEVKVNKFASQSLEREFKYLVQPHLFYYIQYNFFIPEGSVKKLFV